MPKLEQAKALLADALHLDPSRIPDDATMRSFKQWDSLSHMELIALTEETLSCTLTIDDIVRMTSLEGLAALLAEHGKAAK